jgi:hypothetical protein
MRLSSKAVQLTLLGGADGAILKGKKSYELIAIFSFSAVITVQYFVVEGQKSVIAI